MKLRALAAALAAAAAITALAPTPRAHAATPTVTIRNMDTAGVGLNNPTPATPVGGNNGTTLGQQSLNVFQAAADTWAHALDSSVPIVIDASFAALDCSGSEATLGQARPTTFLYDQTGLPSGVYIPMALADHLAGRDLMPGMADIEAMFNGGLAACTGGAFDWYYGLDGKGGDKADLYDTVLHELGHGLGFVSIIDPADGVAPAPRHYLDPFTNNLYDDQTSTAWSAMTDAQRAASALHVRNLVWNGENVHRQAAQRLDLGTPSVSVSPQIAGFGGAISEAEFGPHVSARIAGQILVGQFAAGTCTLSGGSANGKVVVAGTMVCPPIGLARGAGQANAAALLNADLSGSNPPFAIGATTQNRMTIQIGIPVLGISLGDANLLASAPSSSTVTLNVDNARLVGADGNGRVYMFASNPVQAGSSVSHWDVLARPDLLMEPEASGNPVHDVRMELAAFRDMGWHTTCGNGTRDQGEDCDAGADNGASGSPCRADCTNASSSGSGGTNGGSGGRSGSGGMAGTGTGGRGSGGGVGNGTGGNGTGGVLGDGSGGHVSSGTGGQGNSVGNGSGGHGNGSGGTVGGTGGSSGGSSGCHCDATGAASAGSEGLAAAGASLLAAATAAARRRRRARSLTRALTRG